MRGVADHPGAISAGADASQYASCGTGNTADQGAGLPRLCGATITCGNGCREAEPGPRGAIADNGPGWLLSARRARCPAAPRRSLNRTYNGHSGPTAGTGLHAP